MSIAIVIPESWEPSELVRWSATIARAKQDDLLIVRARRLSGRRDRRRSPLNVAHDRSPLALAIREHGCDFTVVDLDAQKDFKLPRKKRRDAEDSQRFLCVKRLSYSALIEGVLEQIRPLRVRQLIIPRPPGVRISEYEFAEQRRLFQEVPCETLQLRPGTRADADRGSILIATSGSKHAAPALHLGATFASDEARELTALYVEERRTPERRRNSGKRNVEKSVRKSLKTKADLVRRDTVVHEDVPGGVRSYATEMGHGLVILGAGARLPEQRRAATSVAERLMADLDEPTVFVVRRAMSVAGRAMKAIEDRKRSLVPQLDRRGRIELVGRLKSSGNWDFDFGFLICLATLLAALGLALNSAPVVLGAMLVAPLMSPMLGLGLSVVQGNRSMAHRCMATVVRGFFVALATGTVFGILRIVFATGLTQQMAVRGEPGVLDLAVAFLSGVVAAYAFGRPHLLSVLPGIAIATSLVPPLATAGLCLTTLELNVALGATFLFLSNFIAIVLGCAASLWVVGMRGPREICAFTAWARRWMLGFFAVAVCLATFFTAKREYSQAYASPVAESDARPSQENVEVRIVLKPNLSEHEAPIEAEMTVTLPPSIEPQTADDDGEAGSQTALQDRPLLRRLRNLSLRLRRAEQPQRGRDPDDDSK